MMHRDSYAIVTATLWAPQYTGEPYQNLVFCIDVICPRLEEGAKIKARHRTSHNLVKSTVERVS